MRSGLVLLALCGSLLPALLFAQTDVSTATTSLNEEARTAFVRSCGTPNTPETDKRSIAERTQFFDTASSRLRTELQRRQSTLSIPIHILAIEGSGGHGRVSDERIRKQVAVLNDNFAKHRISFEWSAAAIDRRVDEEWFATWGGSPIDRERMRLLAIDRKRTMILVIRDPHEDPRDGGSRLAGYAWLPWFVERDGLQDVDSVVVGFDTLPDSGGKLGLGITAVHEAGHWLGLYHVFEGWDETHAPNGGCSGSGDRVSDTPSAGHPDFDCEADLDSCPASPGKDPVDNFLNYGPDSCLVRFTNGQIERIFSVLRVYRPDLLRANPVARPMFSY